MLHLRKPTCWTPKRKVWKMVPPFCFRVHFQVQHVSFWMFVFFGLLHGVDVFQQLSFLCSKVSGQGYRFRLLSMFHGNHVAVGIFDKYIPRCLVNENGVLKEWDLTVSTWNIVITYSWDQTSFGGTSKKWCFWVYWSFCFICIYSS